jgi:hypothetical protein
MRCFPLKLNHLMDLKKKKNNSHLIIPLQANKLHHFCLKCSSFNDDHLLTAMERFY